MTTKNPYGIRAQMTNLEPNRAPLWARLTATFLGTGYLKPAPGSWGSAATVLLWWLTTHFFLTGGPAQDYRPYICAALALFAVGIGIPAATLVARASGKKDPQFVVIDETAGQLITLIAAPVAWKSLLAGFILFRAFDIAKPPPIRLLERLPEGTGIVVDDVGAGLCALSVMQLLLHFGVLI
jgi:phosphatidylglycerophosphatase A